MVDVIHKVEIPGGFLNIEASEDASPEAILKFARDVAYPQYLQETKKPVEEKSSFLRQAADIPVNIAQGAVSGVRMIADAFGADSEVSKSLRGVENYVGDLLSAQAKRNQKEVSRIMKEAEGQGFGDQVLSGLKALSVAPLDTLSNAAGTIAPVVIGTLAAEVLGPAIAVASGLGIGGAMGAGTVKGAIYDSVKQAFLDSGADPAIAEQRAIKAQEYGGENLDMILGGAALGGLEATTGVQPAIKAFVARKLGRELAVEAAAKETGRNVASRVGIGALKEVPLEGLQGAEEKYASNVALAKEGFDVDPMAGVVAQGVLEGTAGGVLGGSVAGLTGKGRTPTQTGPDLTGLKEDIETSRRLTGVEQEFGIPTLRQKAADEGYTPSPSSAAPGYEGQSFSPEGAPPVNASAPTTLGSPAAARASTEYGPYGAGAPASMLSPYDYRSRGIVALLPAPQPQVAGLLPSPENMTPLPLNAPVGEGNLTPDQIQQRQDEVVRQRVQQGAVYPRPLDRKVVLQAKSQQSGPTINIGENPNTFTDIADTFTSRPKESQFDAGYTPSSVEEVFGPETTPKPKEEAPSAAETLFAAPKFKPGPPPTSLSQYIRRSGGINTAGTKDFSGRDLNKRGMNLIGRSKGKSLEKAVMSAIREGYYPTFAAQLGINAEQRFEGELNTAQPTDDMIEQFKTDLEADATGARKTYREQDLLQQEQDPSIFDEENRIQREKFRDSAERKVIEDVFGFKPNEEITHKDVYNDLDAPQKKLVDRVVDKMEEAGPVSLDQEPSATRQTWDQTAPEVEYSKAGSKIAKQKALAKARAEKAAQAEKPEPVTTVTDEERDAAKARIEARLQDIRAMGPQGVVLAEALEKALADRSIDAEKIVSAFEMAHTVGRLLGGLTEAQKVSFSKKLLAGSEEVGGIRQKSALGGLIELSLNPEYAIGTATAAHESFHVLQDVFAQSDKAAGKIINDAFKGAKTIDDVSPNILRILKNTRSPVIEGMSLYDQFKQIAPDSLFESMTQPQRERELQAYTFGFLDHARMNGIQVGTMGSAFTRFMNFLRSFRESMGNFLRGRGFNTVEDMFEGVTRGEQQQGLAGPATTGTGIEKSQATTSDVAKFIKDNINIDNPATSRGATDWLQNKVNRAEASMRENDPSTSAGKGLVGSTTASSDVNIPLKMLQNVPGALDEKRVKGVQKYDELMKDVREKGWNPTAISIVINHLGQPYIYEGNTRVAIAKELGVAAIPARVNWMNGAENVEGDFKLENFAKNMLGSKQPSVTINNTEFSQAKLTPELMNWFGNSVTQKDGVPIRYYTGTSKDVDFKKFKVGRHGVWFTTDPKSASEYAVDNDSMNSKLDRDPNWVVPEGQRKPGDGPRLVIIPINSASRVIPAFLKIENPYRGERPESMMRMDNYKKAQSDWFDTLRRQGYDGWIPDRENGSLAVVLKEPTQIKTIFNTKFDPKNPRMDLSQAKLPPEYSKATGVAQSQVNSQKHFDVWDKVREFFDPFYTVDKFNILSAFRNKLFGTIDINTSKAKRLSETISKGTKAQQDQVYKYLTTKDASPSMVSDPTLRAAAVEVKTAINNTAKQMVKEGILSQESMDKYYDRYLPRMYVYYEMTNRGIKSPNMGISPQEYLKKRDDQLSVDERKMLGEITNPAYLAYVAIARPAKDIAMSQYFTQVMNQSNTKWILPNSVVEVDGQKVTPYWLKSQAIMLENTVLPTLDPTDVAIIAKMKNRIANMKKIADQAINSSNPVIDKGQVPDGYRVLPDSARYGVLRGAVIQKGIYDDIVGTFVQIPTNDKPWLQALMGDERSTVVKLNQLWKMGKVTLNVPSQVRNAISNAIALNVFAGVPLTKMAPRILSAINERMTEGKIYREAKEFGIAGGTMSGAELSTVRARLDSYLRRNNGGGGIFGAFAAARIMAQGFIGKTSEMYQNVEVVFKLAAYMHARDQGMSPSESVNLANDALFDYTRVNPNIRYIRNSPIGLPFVTYLYKVIPKTIETAVKHPLRFAPYLALFYAIPALAMSALDIDEDDYEAMKKTLPEYIRDKGSLYIMPYRGEKGEIKYADLGYFFPWATFVDPLIQMGRGDIAGGTNELKRNFMPSGPIVTAITALATNKDSFTGRDIVDPRQTPENKALALLSYVWNQALPPMLGMDFANPEKSGGVLPRLYSDAFGTGTGMKANGQPKPEFLENAGRLLGLNIDTANPIMARAQNILHMQAKIHATEALRSQVAKDQSLTIEKRRSEIATLNEKIRSDYREIQKYAQETARAPAAMKKGT